MNGMLTKVVAVVAMVAAAGLAQAGGAARVAKRSRGGRLRMTKAELIHRKARVPSARPPLSTPVKARRAGLHGRDVSVHDMRHRVFSPGGWGFAETLPDDVRPGAAKAYPGLRDNVSALGDWETPTALTQ
jgi:hypothetical protein